MSFDNFIEEIKSLDHKWFQVDGCIVNENEDSPGQALLRSRGVDIINEYCGNLKINETAALHQLGLENHETIGLALIGGFGGIRHKEIEIRCKLLEALGLEEETQDFYLLD